MLSKKNTWIHFKKWSWLWRTFSASTDKKNRVIQYDGFLEHWNFCLKHFWIWSIVWVLSLCRPRWDLNPHSFKPRSSSSSSSSSYNVGTVLQSEIAAILQCACVARNHGRGRNIRICSDSRAAITTLGKCIKGIKGIKGNETADRLAKLVYPGRVVQVYGMQASQNPHGGTSKPQTSCRFAQT